MNKTNAMRKLDTLHLNYTVHDYSSSGALSGKEVALSLDENPDQVFKTLVTTTEKHQYFVFCVPVAEELDLKKAAAAVSVKRLEMLPQKELFNLTGYVHGGCSPIGMKKSFVTVLDSTCSNFGTIYVSGGKIGLQLEVNPGDLIRSFGFKTADITKGETEWAHN